MLNTKVVDTHGDCTLAANQFTLVAGTYDIFAHAPAYNSLQHQLRLANITDTTFVYGTSEYDLGNAVTRAFLSSFVVLTASKTFELQHNVGNTQAAFGFGVAGNLGAYELYAEVRIRRIA